MTTPSTLVIREATAADAGACAAIYAPYVRETPISFEELPPDPAEMERRIEGSLCWLVAELERELVGYAYGTRHRDRPAYRWAADVAVYLEPGVHGRGLGRALYGELFARLRERGIWTLCAGITEPNPASTALHRAVGFQPIGTYARIGYKAGAWRDVTWLQVHLRDPGEVPDNPSEESGPRASGAGL